MRATGASSASTTKTRRTDRTLVTIKNDGNHNYKEEKGMTTVRSRKVVMTFAVAAIGAITAAMMFTSPRAEAQGGASCKGQRATIVGSAGSDDIEGTSGRDVIVGRGGNDELEGNGGRDLICSGGGNDEITGDSGNDRLYGGPGFDELDGDGGSDLCRGEDLESCER
jgi:Ca2+-binding RTX toxin-like protein